jgi:hypothetical protein
MSTSSLKSTEAKWSFSPQDSDYYAKVRDMMMSSQDESSSWSNDKFHWDAFSDL